MFPMKIFGIRGYSFLYRFMLSIVAGQHLVYSKKSLIQNLFFRGLLEARSTTEFEYSWTAPATSLRDSGGVFRWPIGGLACLVQMRIVLVNEVFERRMGGEPFEMISFHFLVGSICTPALVSHSVNGSHDTCAVPASLAMNIHRPVGGIVHQFQKLSYSR